MNKPFYVRFRWPLVALVAAAVGARFYVGEPRKAMLGDRVEVSIEERARRMAESEAKLKAYRDSHRGPAAVDGDKALDPKGYERERAMIYVALDTGAMLRFRLGVTNAKVRANEITAALTGACLVNGTAPAPECPRPIAVAADTWTALTACAPRAPLTIADHPTLRVKPRAVHGVVMVNGAPTLAPLAAAPVDGAELYDVIWADQSCAPAAARKAVVAKITHVYALGREPR